MDQPLVQLDFSRGGNAETALREGWSFAEPAFRWTDGARARIHVPYPDVMDWLTLELRLRPVMHPPQVPGQRLRVKVNDLLAGEAFVSSPLALAFPIPRGAFAPGLDITLELPDAIAPAAFGISSDTRQLGVAVEQMLLWPALAVPKTPRVLPPLPGHLPVAEAARGLTGLMPADLLGCFESLGQNSDFGRAQQALGAERPGLLQFAAINQRGVLRGLADGFASLLSPGNAHTDIKLQAGKRVVNLRSDIYGASFATGIDAEPEASLAERLEAYCTQMRGRLGETLARAKTIFVIKEDHVQHDAAALPVLHALRRHADHALLYIVTGDHFPAGTVEQTGDGLYRGWGNAALSPWPGAPVDTAQWLSLCANAYRLWRESGRGG